MDQHKKDEYEVVAYPKLNHVQANIVQIINRNAHIHRTLELGLALGGDGVVRIGDRSFVIHKGSLFFFNANESHEIAAASEAGVRIAYLQVANSFCSEYISCFRNLELLENDLSNYLSPENRHEVTKLMVQALMDYLAPNSDLYALNCVCSICKLYSKLLSYVPYQQMTEAAYLSKNKKTARLTRITEYIDTNYAEKITLEALAKQEDVTTTYLSHFIKDNLHMTFQDYVSSVRFERALKLLQSTTMCLTDVSVVCGFSDVKYLSRMLERYFGMPAQACREHLQQSREPKKTQLQTFVTEETGLAWLREFWKDFSEKGLPNE